MKKLKILSILLITIFMTGCVKLNASMKINKDKSMDYEIIMAYDKTLAEKAESQFDEESIKEAEKNGFKATEYNDGTMIGYKFTKHIKNIDSVSSNENVTGSLDVNADSKYLFTVKKGFLKNTYKAKLISKSTNLSDLDTNSWNITTSDNTDNENIIDASNDSVDLTDSIDYSKMANMELKFEVTLPYNALTSNASTNNGKTLTWNLLTFKNDAIEFEFEMYNNTNILIIAIVLFIILIIIVLILNRTSKKKKENNDNTISVDNNFGQANNISNVEESMQAQDVWTDESVQTIQPNMNEQYMQPPEPQPIPQQMQPNMNEQVPTQNVFEQELNNQNENTY